MKATYDKETDTFRILFNGNAIAKSDEHKPGVIIDYDGSDNVVGLEILDASMRTDNPAVVEYDTAA